MEITNQIIDIIEIYQGVGICIIITCIIAWFVMAYFLVNSYYKEKESNEKEKENEKIRRDNYIINSITCELREIVREEMDKK